MQGKKLLSIALVTIFILSCSSDDGDDDGIGGDGIGGGVGVSGSGYRAGYKACVLGYRNPDASIMGCLRMEDGSDFPEKYCSLSGDNLERSCPGNSNQTCPIGYMEILMYGEFGQIWSCEWTEEWLRINLQYVDRRSSSSSSVVSSSSLSSSSFSSSSSGSSSSSVSSSISRCGGPSGVLYNPATEACCGTKKYNTTDASTQFCYSNEIYSKCGGEPFGAIYDPTTEACCDTRKFTEATHFCFDDVVTIKCSGMEYTSSQFCFDEPNGPLLDRCGGPYGPTYNPTTEACCGTRRYNTTNASTQFCYSNDIYSKCGDKEYDPSTEFCLNDVVTKKCAGAEYTSSEFCLDEPNGPVLGKCGGVPYGATYNPETEACCDTRKFTKATHFCLDEVITIKCSGMEYTSSQFCFNDPYGPLLGRCGGVPSGPIYNPYTEDCCVSQRYNISSQFCSVNNTVLTRCGGSAYNPNTQFCLDDVVTQKCGGKEYTSSEFCFNGNVLDKCGGVSHGATYNPNTQACCDISSYNLNTQACCNTKIYPTATEFCYKVNTSEVRNLCGGQPYATNEFCFNGRVEGKCGGVTSEDESVIYNPNTQACCLDKKYNIDTYFCYGNNEIKDLCGGPGGKPYLRSEFCSIDNDVVPRCDNSYLGADYNPNTEACCYRSSYNLSTQACCNDDRRYEVATEFCYGGYQVRNLCGGVGGLTYETYEFCIDNNVDQKCGNVSDGDTLSRPKDDCCHFRRYDVATEFCYNWNYSEVRNLCGGLTYTATEFCLGNTVTPRCGGLTYTASQFCSGTTVYNKCGGSVEYDPATHFCLGNTVTPRCGGLTYTASQFCSGTSVYNKCGGSVEYDPTIEDCCGSQRYNISTQFCSGTSVYNKCGGSVEYDPTTEICCGTSIFPIAESCIAP